LHEDDRSSQHAKEKSRQDVQANGRVSAFRI
jgi:hypothetical protein